MRVKSESQPTPGPWTLRESALSCDGDLWFIAGPRSEDPDIHGEARMPRVAEVWTEVNARLIAAAPELLAALKALSDMAYAAMYYDTTDENAAVVFAQARAALAKAEGR